MPLIIGFTDRNSRSSSSYPEGTSEGTSLLDGSLVFRPYTQVRRTICTSVSLRASTRVSSGSSPRSGIVHHLSGPDRLLGPCLRRGRDGGARLASAGAAVCRSTPKARAVRTTIGATAFRGGISTARALAAPSIRAGPRPEADRRPALAVPHPTGAHRRPPSASLPTISSTL
ncbi:UNVERIFIED_CONTAM: hypothetical protein Sangu_2564100 [Sesamum angustifolium]|uniref:Uncharacterized protein n=1 Tax=Sesamum angustifolium TaxID=2727405 RepID=A0AAW2J896_9LAMI